MSPVPALLHYYVAHIVSRPNWEFFWSDSVSLLHTPILVTFFFLSSSLLSGTTRYKMRRAHLDVSCPSLRIIIYFSRSTGLFLENGVRDQGLGPGCAHVLHFFFFFVPKKDVAVLLFSFWSKRSFVCILFGDYIMGRVIMDASLSGVDLFCACCPFRFNIKHKNVLNYWLAS